MKPLLVLVAISINFLLPKTALTSEALTETVSLKKQLEKVEDLQAQHALIKNKADLKFYQTITYPGFPLNVFSSEYVRQDFLDSIKFSEKGLYRFNPGTLSTLTFDEAYRLLDLFGMSNLAKHYAAPDLTAEHGSITTPYLNNTEYPLLAQLRAIDNQDDINVSDFDKLAAFRDFYDNTILPELEKKNCSERGHHKTLAVLEMLYTINFFRNDQDIAGQYLACFNDYARQFSESKYIPSLVTDAYKSLLSSRLLEAANKLKQQYPEIQVGDLPTIQSREIKGPSVYRIAADEATLIQQAFSFNKRTEVLVIAHPYCRFCQMLIKDIVADEKLSQFFKNHSRWIADETYLSSIDAIVDWNKKYPMASLDIAYLKQDFTELEEWATPAIYFLNDGEVLDKLIGWPEEGRKHALKSLIETHFPDFEKSL